MKMRQHIAKQISYRNYFSDIQQFRNLIYSFAWKEIKQQYTQTFSGFFLLLMQPLISIIIFTLLFSYIIHIDSPLAPYPLYIFSGLVIWSSFSYLLQESCGSLVNNASLIKKNAFPRMVLPLSKVLVSLFQFCVSFIILMIAMMIWGITPELRWFLFIIPVVLYMIVALSVGFWISALSLRFKDLLVLVPYLIGFGVWLTPVFYPESLVLDRFSIALYVNPLAGCAVLFRYIMFGGDLPSANYLIGFILPVILFVTGLFRFIRSERFAADYL